MSSESNPTSNSEVSSSNSSIVKQLGGKKPKGHKKACKCVICKRGGADTVSMDDKTVSSSDDVDEDESASVDNKKDDVVKDDKPVEGVEGVEDTPSASDNNKDLSPSKGGKRRRRRTAKKGKSRRNKSRRSTKRTRSSRRR